jgi:hypothetical protein
MRRAFAPLPPMYRPLKEPKQFMITIRLVILESGIRKSFPEQS